MSTTGFTGARSTQDWAANQRPQNYRELIAYLYPNGSAPLTALTAMIKSEKVDDPHFHWWTKTLPVQGGAILGAYTDTALSSAYTSGATKGTTLYFNVAEATANHFRVGHQALMRDASDLTVDTIGRVVTVVKNGASSYIGVELLENDDNSSSGDLSDADTILVKGNINAEGAAMPSALSYDPVEFENRTQIFRTPLDITRTALHTYLRTGDAYKELKRETLMLHSIELEKAFLWSIMTSGVGDNGKPMRTTMGVVPMIKTYAPNNVLDFRTDPNYSGQTWLAAGEEWFDNALELPFRWSEGRDLLALCGSGAKLGLTRLAKAGGYIQINPKTKYFGLDVEEWIGNAGRLMVKVHPLMSQETTERNSMIILDAARLRYRFITDTMFKPDDRMKKGSWSNVDGIKEEFLTEAGLEYLHPDSFAYFTGVGQDNVV